MLNNLQNLSNHVDEIGRPFEKYYDNSTLKSRKGIHSTLDFNHDFYKNESMEKSRYDMISPRHFLFTSIPPPLKRKPQLPTSPKKYQGINVLYTPITPVSARPVNANNPRRAESTLAILFRGC